MGQHEKLCSAVWVAAGPGPGPAQSCLFTAACWVDIQLGRASRRWDMERETRNEEGRMDGALKATVANTAFPRVCLLLKTYLFERGRERIPSRLSAEHRA